MRGRGISATALLCLALLCGAGMAQAQAPKPVVNDVSQLNPIAVDRVITPTSVEEIAQAVKGHAGPISIGGARHSMGGQIATEGSLFIDMRRLNRIVSLSPEEKLITVQAGATWRQIQEAIDPYNLAITIMQSYANFTVGGSLSVNAHGRYVGQGPLILSVRSIKVVLADGSLVAASPDENAPLFYGCIGGYGGLGVIVEATLELTDNTRLARQSVVLPLGKYRQYFLDQVRDSPSAVFHNGDLYPPDYTTVRATTWSTTDRPVTVPDRLIPLRQSYWLNHLAIALISEAPLGKQLRQYVLDPWQYRGERVVWRNYESSYDVEQLEPSSRQDSTYVLQEYFVPVERFDAFSARLAEVLRRYHVNTLNVSLRHARPDPGSLLAWANGEVFAFVLYYKQGTTPADREEVGIWARELIDAALEVGGSYYLPYQIHATDEQFRRAYPRAGEFLALKQRLDPTNKFRNKLWDAYDPNGRTRPAKPASPAAPGRFKLLGDTAVRDNLYRFLQNVYRLYPPGQYLHLIVSLAGGAETDEQVYRGIQRRLPEVTPWLWGVRYALPALWQQKQVIADQTRELLGSNPAPINGYLEIGTTGRYVNPLKQRLRISGPVYLVGEDAPSYSPSDIAERGQLLTIGTFIASKYDPIDRQQVPDVSVDLVTNYVGFHHAPRERLDAYVRSIARVLRPGGRLVVREHDVDSPQVGAFVSLVHDVFYAGLGNSWEYDSTEVREFWSIKEMEAYLEARGFKATGKRLLQGHDPSRNTLTVLVRAEGG